MTWKRGFAVFLTMVVLISLGCQHANDHLNAHNADSAKTVVNKDAFPFNVAAATLLAAADALDGEKDKVVSKCGGCALAMDGSHDHALEVGDYQMNFCSSYCKDGFEKNTEEAVMAMKVPAATTH